MAGQGQVPLVHHLLTMLAGQEIRHLRLHLKEMVVGKGQTLAEAVAVQVLWGHLLLPLIQQTAAMAALELHHQYQAHQ